MKKKKPEYEGKLRLKKGDEVMVLAGRDKGRKGKIIEVEREDGAIIVDGINMVTRHQKPRGTGRQAAVKAQTGIIDKPAPLPIGKVKLVCPKCSKPTRLESALTAQGQRSRVCKNCRELIDVK